MDQKQQSVFIKEECDLDWDEKDNIYGATEDLHVEKIKVEKGLEDDFSDQHILSEINGTNKHFKFEKIKVEVSSPSEFVPPKTNGTSRQLDELEKIKLKEECLSDNFSVKIDPLIRCSKCGIDTKNFHEHSSQCKVKSSLYCVYCPFKVNSVLKRQRFRLLMSHIAHAHLERKPKACYKCGSLVKSWYLPYHLKICGGQSQDYYCDDCSFQTKHMTSLRRHIKYSHLGGESVTCPECKKRLTNEGKLGRHLVYCKRKPQLCCKICNFTTNKRKYFMKHVLTLHFF